MGPKSSPVFSVNRMDLGIQMDKEENDKFVAIITNDNYNAGDLVRWYVQATDAGSKSSRSPPFTQADYPEYYGTVIYSPDVRSTLPIFQWFVQDPQAAISTAGSRSALFYNGYLYDNVATRRRGVTALSWPKPTSLLPLRFIFVIGILLLQARMVSLLSLLLFSSIVSCSGSIVAEDFVMSIESDFEGALQNFQTLLSTGDISDVVSIFRVAFSDEDYLQGLVDLLIESFDDPNFVVEALVPVLVENYNSGDVEETQLVGLVADVLGNITIAEPAQQLVYAVFTTMSRDSRPLFIDALNMLIQENGCEEVSPLLTAGEFLAQVQDLATLYLGTVRQYPKIAQCLDG
eukprot:TRINITY_DN465_c1_g1_i3.p1 TRINITY_DN465_c1_g1~~TRINITY_DN465_c1_g1_i3.p1  ORF type:complete len:346 (+),score=26.30 TRINITY_DN465_c1_g1_i3:186-1223(+)